MLKQAKALLLLTLAILIKSTTRSTTRMMMQGLDEVEKLKKQLSFTSVLRNKLFTKINTLVAKWSVGIEKLL